ncbi:tape measure protein, partial [Flavonifractor sp. An306]
MSEIREDLVLYDRFTEAFTRYIREIENASESTRRMRQIIDDLEGSQRRTAAASSDLASTIRNLAGTYLGFQGARSMLDLSDMIASNTARLDMMNDGLQTTEELNQMIFDSAQRSRGAYADTAAFVAQLGNLAGDAFSSSAEVVAFAEQINKQMAISGTAGQQAEAAMLQLTQGLASGALRGEELNSVMENSSMIAQTIADYMGVTTGELRELASEGQVTATIVKNAMFAAAEETNAKFAEMPMTWAQQWNQMKNLAIQAVMPLLESVNQL